MQSSSSALAWPAAAVLVAVIVGMIVTVALGKLSGDVAAPIFSAIAVGLVGHAAGFVQGQRGGP